MMTESEEHVLESLASQGVPCTLSLPTAPVALLRRSRLLKLEEGSLWVELNSSDNAAIESLASEGLPVHITIRSHEQDILFHAAPIEVDPDYISSDKRCVCALRLKLPDQVATSQRRKTFRVMVCELDGVSMRIWRVNEYVLMRDRVLPSQELPCRLKDLGEGGFGATVFPRNDEALGLKANQRFRVELTCGRHELVFEARLRHPEQTQRDDESAECGFEFIHNDRDVESRRHLQKLQLLLSELQRNAVKRDQA